MLTIPSVAIEQVCLSRSIHYIQAGNDSIVLDIPSAYGAQAELWSRLDYPFQQGYFTFSSTLGIPLTEVSKGR